MYVVLRVFVTTRKRVRHEKPSQNEKRHRKTNIYYFGSRKVFQTRFRLDHLNILWVEPNQK